MKLLVVGLGAFCLAVGLVTRAEQSGFQDSNRDAASGSAQINLYHPPSADDGTASSAFAEADESRRGERTIDRWNTNTEWAAILRSILGSLQDEVVTVEAMLTNDASPHPRVDLLARYGHFFMVDGQFEMAAAAYAIFLREFGSGHRYSERIAVRLGDSLAPLDLDTHGITRTAEGPVLQATWRMGHVAEAERLRQAIAAYTWAADITSSPHRRNATLLTIGWVYRALNDWDASTAAWEHCANACQGTKEGANARLLACENLELLDRPAEAARQLHTFIADYPAHYRVRSARKRAILLEQESRRGADWSDDPVRSLNDEIRNCRDVCSSWEAYLAAASWLERRDRIDARLTLDRWAITQTGWPMSARVQAHQALVTALLSASPPNGASLSEAADILGKLVDFAPPDWSAPAALRRARLLSQMGRFELADQVLDDVEAQSTTSPRWTPLVLAERIQSRLDRGDEASAVRLFHDLAQAYPDLPVTKRYAEVLPGVAGKEVVR